MLQSTTPVLLRTTKDYSVLQSASPILICTAKCYSSSTPYFKVLVQYYSVLPSTTAVVLRAAKYYSSTTPYYKVLLQYYSVLQSTTPILLCTAKYYSVVQSTSPVLLCTTKYYSVLQSITPCYSSTTLYYKVLLQYYSVLQSNSSQKNCRTLPTERIIKLSSSIGKTAINTHQKSSLGSACERLEHHQDSCPSHAKQQPEKLRNVTYGTHYKAKLCPAMQNSSQKNCGTLPTERIIKLSSSIEKTDSNTIRIRVQAMQNSSQKNCGTLPTERIIKLSSSIEKTAINTHQKRFLIGSGSERFEHHQDSCPSHAKQQPENCGTLPTERIIKLSSSIEKTAINTHQKGSLGSNSERLEHHQDSQTAARKSSERYPRNAL